MEINIDPYPLWIDGCCCSAMLLPYIWGTIYMLYTGHVVITCHHGFLVMMLSYCHATITILLIGESSLLLNIPPPTAYWRSMYLTNMPDREQNIPNKVISLHLENLLWLSKKMQCWPGVNFSQNKNFNPRSTLVHLNSYLVVTYAKQFFPVVHH